MTVLQSNIVPYHIYCSAITKVEPSSNFDLTIDALYLDTDSNV